MVSKKLGEIDVLEIPGEADGPVIVLFHGLGASNQDLAGLQQAVKAQAGTTWIFPNGVVDLGQIAGSFGMPGFQGRSWWGLDENSIRYMMTPGAMRDLSNFEPPGIEELRRKIRDLITAIQRPLNEITIGGFSQGAMLAMDTVLHLEENPAGLVLLSGSVVTEKTWRSQIAGRAGLQFFQSHGKDDPVLSFGVARKLEGMLREGGLTGEFVAFNGGHEIPPPVLARLGQYLRR